MSNESEAKIGVPDFVAVRRRLKQFGATFLGTADQVDTHFDTSNRMVRKTDCGLRIRTLRCRRRGDETWDGRPLLTFKGPRAGNGRIKSRREVETRVDDAKALAAVLEALGFSPQVTIQKRRSSYRFGRCRVELDTVDGLGRFVEIEGRDEAAIRLACKKLGLEFCPIKQSYLELLADRGLL